VATNIGVVLEALADPTRRAVWEQLALGPMTVGELAASLPVSRPAVSQHLKVLAAADLVSATPQGTRRIYAARQEGLRALREYLDTMWRDGLESYAAAIDRQNQKTEDSPA
jgi:DNA-binding transcriptional ArsR family regulator